MTVELNVGAAKLCEKIEFCAATVGLDGFDNWEWARQSIDNGLSPNLQMVTK
jgi:hypothetical protein